MAMKEGVFVIWSAWPQLLLGSGRSDIHLMSEYCLFFAGTAALADFFVFVFEYVVLGHTLD